ncbi:BrnA antitoxin family protein [Azospirillum sp. SYSU D00513]|uniref:BrnA antitoxin family protein n=1 Tax=Azospirillum sp. SYSU D00513 TaxID=2812561 RepID=UPI001A965B51|nr:BrnA antitoxin family protein [Azospirillum sp. SYSU D00513]
MSENKHDIGSNLAKVDAHTIQPAEYDEAPELDDEWFADATIHEDGRLVPRGRPRLENPKQQVTLRLDAEVVERFKADGPGWQTRINDALRKSAGL